MQGSIIEEPILDLKRKNIIDLVEAGIVFNHATLHKAKKEKRDLQRL